MAEEEDSRREKTQMKVGNKSWKKTFLSEAMHLAVLAAVVGVVILGWKLYKDNSSQIPGNIKKSANFTLYYPTKLPDGYTFDKNSPRIENGIAFFSLVSSAKKIQISEQAIPRNPPDLKKIDGFNTFDTSAGSAAVGNTNSNTVVIMLTDDSLISIQGSGGVTRPAVIETARQMRRL